MFASVTHLSEVVFSQELSKGMQFLICSAARCCYAAKLGRIGQLRLSKSPDQTCVLHAAAVSSLCEVRLLLVSCISPVQYLFLPLVPLCCM